MQVYRVKVGSSTGTTSDAAQDVTKSREGTNADGKTSAKDEVMIDANKCEGYYPRVPLIDDPEDGKGGPP